MFLWTFLTNIGSGNGKYGDNFFRLNQGRNAQKVVTARINRIDENDFESADILIRFFLHQKPERDILKYYEQMAKVLWIEKRLVDIIAAGVNKGLAGEKD